MLSLLYAMTLVLLSWLGLGAIFTGIGLLLRRGAGLPLTRLADLPAAFWLGWGTVIIFLQLWHYVWPVNGLALGLFALAGALGLACQGTAMGQLLRQGVAGRLPLCLVGGLLLLWLANHALRAPLNTDSGLYHLSAVRWLVSYPIVPGLGNLHGRLAFNNSYFLYPALLEAGPWAGRAAHVANSLLLAVFLVQTLGLVGGLVSASRSRRLLALGALVLLPAALDKVYRLNAASPSPDLSVFLVGGVLFFWLLTLLLEPPAPPREQTFALIQIALLALVGLTLKLSFAVLGGGMVLVALGVGWRRLPAAAGSTAKLGGTLLLLMAVVLVPWLGRGIILSGYPLYPATLGSVAVEWRVPAAQAEQEAAMVTGFARQPEVDYRRVNQSWGWVGPWLGRMAGSYDVTPPFILVALGLLSWPLVRRGPAVPRPPGLGLILLPPAAAVLFWVTTAPDPRFLGAALWLLAAATVLLLVAGRGPETGRDRLTLGAAIIIFLVAAPPLIRHVNLVGPGPDGGFYPTPVAVLEPYTTTSGLELLVPRHQGLCWDAPLPCTPAPQPGLRLRRPPDLGRGFVVDRPGAAR